ncbi:MAG: hypothetical protein ACYSRZ_01185 [Planctomycetota bacterium]|jgi:hypothetical protein
MYSVKETICLAAVVALALFSAQGCNDASVSVTTMVTEPEKQTIQAEPSVETVVETAKLEPAEQMAPAVPETEPDQPLTEEKAVKLALKFKEFDTTKYMLNTESLQRVSWQGPKPENLSFQGGKNETKIKMIFTQRIEAINVQGITQEKITIEQLKYHSVLKDSLAVDFDSNRKGDVSSPLARMIGRSYNIQIAPNGDVVRVFNTEDIAASVEGETSDNKAALRLIDPNVIRERHGMIMLPRPEENQLEIDDDWSNVKVFFFGLMGHKVYERIYTLEEIEQNNNAQLAIVEMEAMPTTELAEELHKKLKIRDFSNIFDSSENYTGWLKFDLTSGKIQEYSEKMDLEWLAVDPSSGQQQDTEPSAISMGVVRSYNLKRIN